MASDSNELKTSDAAKNQGLPPLYVGIAVVAFLLAVGGAYVVMNQTPAGQPTPGPQASPSANVPAVTPSPSSNYSLPKEAELTGIAACPNDAQVPVLLFTDPYCPACVQIEPQVNAFYDKYGPKTDVQYRFVSTHSHSLEQAYGNDVVYQAHDFMTCAQEQGKIRSFKDCFYGTLPYKDGDFIPLNRTQLDACAADVGLDKAALDACLPGARQKVVSAIKEAAGFGGGSYFTPMAVVNCQYRVNSAQAEKTYCAVSGAC